MSYLLHLFLWFDRCDHVSSHLLHISLLLTNEFWLHQIHMINTPVNSTLFCSERWQSFLLFAGKYRTSLLKYLIVAHFRQVLLRLVNILVGLYPPTMSLIDREFRRTTHLWLDFRLNDSRWFLGLNFPRLCSWQNSFELRDLLMQIFHLIK